MKMLQDKTQVELPSNRNDDGSSGWVSQKSARQKNFIPGRARHAGADPDARTMNTAVMANSLPPGMDIEDQEFTDQRQFKTVMSGESDVSHDFSAGAVKSGFTRRTLSPTDDEYTNQHNDAFYDEVKVDGVTGFVERNNVLDRL